MRQYGVILLKDSCPTRIFCHGMEDQCGFWHRFNLYREIYDDWFLWLLGCFLIDDVECEFRYKEHFVIVPLVGSAVGAIIHFCPGVADAHAKFCLHAEVAVQSPRPTVEGSDGSKVALFALVTHRFVESEWKFHATHIVVAVDEVQPPVGTVEGAVVPMAQFWG